MLTCQGHLHTYRFVDNVWTMVLENASFKTETETVAADKVKIVACDGNVCGVLVSVPAFAAAAASKG